MGGAQLLRLTGPVQRIAEQHKLGDRLLGREQAGNAAAVGMAADGRVWISGQRFCEYRYSAFGVALGQVYRLGLHPFTLESLHPRFHGSGIAGSAVRQDQFHRQRLNDERLCGINFRFAMNPNWMLIDGSSLIFRAFYGVPNTAPLADGRQTNAVRGFLDTLARLITSRKPLHVAIASDEDWRPQRRVDLIASYKAHRVAEPIPPALIPQMGMLHKVLDAMGMEFFGESGLEAEDVIASWTEQMDGPIEIVSGDRDLFSLVRDHKIMVLYPEKGGLAEIDEKAIGERYGIPGRNYSDFAILRGDPSDGLPGVAGIGPKTAAALINKYGDIDAICASGKLTPQGCEYVQLAKQVVIPGSPNPVRLPVWWAKSWPKDPVALSGLVPEYGIGSSTDRLLQALRALPVPRV